MTLFKSEKVANDLIREMSVVICDYRDWFSVAKFYVLDPHRDYVKIYNIMKRAREKWD